MFEHLRKHFEGHANIAGYAAIKGLDEAEAEIMRLNKVITDFDINKIRADLFKANEKSNHYKAIYERSHEQSQTILDKNFALLQENETLKDGIKERNELILAYNDHGCTSKTLQLKDENAKLREELERLKDVDVKECFMGNGGIVPVKTKECLSCGYLKRLSFLEASFKELKEEYSSTCKKYQNLRSELHNLSK